MVGRLESWTRNCMRLLGLSAVLCTLLLSIPGIRAVRADEPAPAPATSEQPADASGNFEGFSSYLQAQGRPVPVVEEAGPTCSQPSRLAPEIEHRLALAQLQARMIAEMQAGGAQGVPSDVVVLNNSGYNYRPVEPGMPAPQQPAPPTP